MRLAVALAGTPGGAITLCPEGQIGESNLLLVVTLEQPGPAELAGVKGTLCAFDLPALTALVGACDPASEALVTAQISPTAQLLAALPGVTHAPVAGAVDGTQPGAAVGLERITVTVGASVASGGAALPAWDTAASGCSDPDLGRTPQCEAACVSDCAPLRDDDGDGYPGVSVDVCGTTQDDVQSGALCRPEAPNEPGSTLQGRAFIDLEVDPRLTGEARSSCEVVGAADSQVRYQLVGADLYLAGAPLAVSGVIKSLPSIQVDPAQSRFRMVRIDGQHGASDWGVDPADPAAACATVLARVNEL